MSERNWFDEAARVIALPVPRRKALKYATTGFAGALLSFLWPGRAMATDYDPWCSMSCSGCTNTGCWGKRVDDPCTVGGIAGHCAQQLSCNNAGAKCCSCVPGPPPDAPTISSIPDVTITREASLAAGNCLEGTEWVSSWFPGRNSVPAREVAAAAIARGKPRMARYIARTAHLVARGPQASRIVS